MGQLVQCIKVTGNTNSISFSAALRTSKTQELYLYKQISSFTLTQLLKHCVLSRILCVHRTNLLSVPRVRRCFRNLCCCRSHHLEYLSFGHSQFSFFLLCCFPCQLKIFINNVTFRPCQFPTHLSAPQILRDIVHRTKSLNNYLRIDRHVLSAIADRRRDEFARPAAWSVDVHRCSSGPRPAATTRLRSSTHSRRPRRWNIKAFQSLHGWREAVVVAVEMLNYNTFS